MSTQIPGLYILETEEKGRGVFTSVPISKGDLIESAPVIIINDEDRKVIHETKLHDYYFLWGNGPEKSTYHAAIALGYGSLYNHSKEANAEFVPVFEEEVIEFVATRDIEAGEEILIKYDEGNHADFELWF